MYRKVSSTGCAHHLECLNKPQGLIDGAANLGGVSIKRNQVEARTYRKVVERDLAQYTLGVNDEQAPAT